MGDGSPEVTVCVPAYQGEAFIGETLEHVRRQSFDDLRIVVSVDPSTDSTERICRRFAERDPRFEVHPQGGRLGWVGNMNYLLDAVDTELFFILPQDDLIGEGYVETLREALKESPRAVNAYADIVLFGAIDKRFTLDAPSGQPFERMLGFLAGGPNGIPLRGLTRVSVARAGVRFRDNAFAGFYAGTVYVLELLRLGECRRVAEPLYRKRVWEESVHVGEWNSWQRERAMGAWVEHTLSCLEAIAAADLEVRERYALAAACIMRLQRQLHRDGELDPRSAGDGFDELAAVTALAARAAGLGSPQDGLAGLREPAQPLRSMISNLRLVEGVEQRDRGRREVAAALFDAAREADPGSAEAALQRSTIHHALKRPDEGLALARRAAELAPHDPRPELMISRLLAQKGELAPAARAARRALELDPENEDARARLAALQHRSAG